MNRKAITIAAPVLAALLLSAVYFVTSDGSDAFSAPPTESASLDDQLSKILETDDDIDYRIHAFRIGHCESAQRKYFIDDPTMPKRIPVSFGMWMIEGNGRRILVDTGFVSKRMIEQWKLTEYRTPVELLKNAGYDVESITDVIISHRHWDHVGGLHFFKDLPIWISKETLGALSKTRSFRTYFENAESSELLNKTGRITKVAPGIVTVHVGLHAPGCQMAVVNRKGKRWVLTSDITPLYANYTRKIPTGQSTDPDRTLEIQETVMKWVDGDLRRIVPGHEPEIFKGKEHVVLTDSE